MVYIRLQGHNYEYDVGALVKTFYFNRDIKFISDKTLADSQGLLIENIVTNTMNGYKVITKIYNNQKEISEFIIKDINSIKILDNNSDRKIKIAVKQSIYKAISKISEVNAPWGILTGIRPTKIVHDFLDSGYNSNDIYKILTEQYLLNEEKSSLILSIALKERKFLYPMDRDRFSMYISIPFCPTRCLYCSFPSNSLVQWGKLVDEYTDKLIFEIEQVGKTLANRRINSLYIGGGTPTAIPAENLDRILKSVYNIFDRDKIREVTVEAGRPDTVTEEMLEMLKENKVDRISINPQTMNEGTLDLIGRNHNPEDIIRAYKLANKIGFDSINMDIIIGLPNEKEEDVINTMEEIIKLSPNNLTVHTMAVKRASKLREKIDEYSLTQQRSLERMLDITKEYAKKMKMEPYYMYRQKQILGNFENVGYSTKGKECIYNMAIMEEKETIIAFGAGATSKIFYPNENRFQRVPNVKNLKVYLERVKEMIERKKNLLEIS
ncbi:MAG: coproporphyrinogen dehydrogenase HemZ [Firmicutes bacterium]|nr:coproporphyrinogen dehydrogenase HemZ [Bacillota bacterium]